MQKKIIPIKYTSRNFQTIKNDLVEHAKRYYPSSFKDFNEGSFGSLMVDTVAYVGDILSFYLDYQANESFLDTATEFNNVLRIARQMGYRQKNGGTSTGLATFYIAVPTNNSSLGPDMTYAPVLKKGSTFSTKNKTKFILNEDVRFDSPKNEVRVLRVGEGGNPISYGIKSKGLVISGIMKSEVVPVDGYERYKKVKLSESNIVEIMSVYDDEGNEYYEVENLSQNVIYKSITNKDPASAKLAKEILRPFIAPRRFTVETELNATYLQFGASSDIVMENENKIAEPSTVVFNLYGKDYISSDSFDPSALLSSDKMGISPSNTNLTVTYRYNPVGVILNFGVDSLSEIDEPILEFNQEENLNPSLLLDVRESLEVTNDNALVGDVTPFDSKELKIKIKNIFSAQNRAVTAEDYKTMCYLMPTKYGAIKRINIVKDYNSLKRNLNMFVLCEDEKGYLTQANNAVKSNLKSWIMRNKMINDSIDILDGKIVNYAIEFVAVGSPNRSKFDSLTDAVEQLKKDLSMLPDFGEPLFITNIWSSLKKVDGILDVVSVKVVPRIGGSYSDAGFNFEKQTSSDNRYIDVPLNVVMELKYPDSDIKGTIL